MARTLTRRPDDDKSCWGVTQPRPGPARLAACLGPRPPPSPLPGAPAVLSRASEGAGCSVGTPPPRNTHTPQMKAGRVSSAPGHSRIRRFQTFLSVLITNKTETTEESPGGAHGNVRAGPHARGHKRNRAWAREKATRNSAGLVADKLLAKFPG